MLHYILLQAEAVEGGGGSPWILIGGMFLIMYIFMIRPQAKRQREAKSFREGIAKGDRVVTIGGLHGKIISISEKTVVIELESGKVRVDKTALSPTGAPDEQEIAK